DGAILATKLDVHARYSRIPIDLPGTVAALVAAPNAADILDIGCGTGHVLDHLAALGHTGRLVGVDLAPPTAPKDSRIQFISGDADQLPLPDGSFDVATCIHTLSHIRDLSTALAEAGRVLRPGGRFIATANSIRSYPHAANYRRRIHDRFRLGIPIFTTSNVN